MNKKVVSVLLSTVLAAGLAISAFAAPADSESVKKAADEGWEIAVVPKDSTNPWFVRMKAGVDGFASETGVDCYQVDTGTIDAYEVPQLYTRQRSGDLARPICELRGFQKIFIPAGETRTVSFTLTKEQLGYWHEKKNGLESRVWFATDDADFQIWIAPNCGQRVN